MIICIEEERGIKYLTFVFDNLRCCELASIIHCVTWMQFKPFKQGYSSAANLLPLPYFGSQRGIRTLDACRSTCPDRLIVVYN